MVRTRAFGVALVALVAASILVLGLCCDRDNPEAPNIGPTASFTVSPASGPVGTSFLVDASGSSDPEDEPSDLLARWDWESDGIWDTDWSAAKTESHTYAAVGTPTITLSVKDSEGATDDTSQAVTISPINLPPRASFTVTPGTGSTDTLFRFDASACWDPQDPCSLLAVKWDWQGDGTWDTDPSRTKTATHKYRAGGTYVATLMVTDTEGAAHDTSRTIVVTEGGSLPLASFTVTPTWGGSSTDFVFDATKSRNRAGEGSGLDAWVQVRWDWEDDGTWDTDWSVNKTPSHRYSSEGLKTARLMVKSSVGTTDDTTRTIRVTDHNTPPAAAFAVSPPAGTPDMIFRFDASPSSDLEDEPASLAVRWDWENDGTWDTHWSTVKAVDHAFSTNGNKTVGLQVKDTGGEMGDTTGTVIMPGYPTPPVADFTVEPATGGLETIFQFDASACSDYQDPESLLVVRWDWESDEHWDCAWTSTKTATHQYDSLGTKQVTLQVKDTDTQKTSITKPVWVVGPNHPPTAVFTITPLSGNGHTQFAFDASGSSDPDEPASALQVRWDWQDDGVWDTWWLTSKTASLSYGANPGIKTVRLRVKDSYGVTADTTGTLEVTDYNAPPVAAFGISPATGTPDTVFHFDASPSHDPDDALADLRVRWDWESDGTWDTSWSVSKTAQHKFGAVGAKMISLAVKDSWNVIAQTTDTLVVTANPVASFTVEPATGTPDTVFRFDASASSDAEDPASALEVRWDFENDGTWDTDWSPDKMSSHQYGHTGAVTVRLVVRDTGGALGYAARSFEITGNDYPDGDPIGRDELVEAVNGFGFDLFREMVSEKPDSNVIASPLSVSLAFGMTANGARGATQNDMLSALHLEGHSAHGAAEIYEEIADLLTTLDPQVQFEIANSIWYQTGFAVKQPFVDACTDHFDAEVRAIDLLGDPSAADTINAWVSEKTHGKIPQIVSNPINAVVILMDAIYFLGRWKEEFDPAYTRDDWFYRPDGSRQLCKMMRRPGPDPEPFHRNFADFDYYSDNPDGPTSLQIVDLAYGDSIFSMTIVLPRGATTVDDLIAQLDTTQWNDWMASLDHCHGRVYLPRFELSLGRGLIPALSQIGMASAFRPGADLSGIADGLAPISVVRHKIYMKVNESGTEAGAVTEIEIPVGNIPDCAGFDMNINHPFLFVIRENRANTILFVGKVAQPN